jgi:hypothetical protein
MKYMNSWEIDSQIALLAGYPVLHKAARFLQRFRDLIDDNSDGWAYWRPPVKAAKRLMELIESNEPAAVTEDDLKKALKPIRSFATRHGLILPALD